MRMIGIILIGLLASALPAQAGPVVAIVGTVIAGIKAFAAASIFGAWLVKTALSIGLSLLANSLRAKPRPAGITTTVTTTGGATPQKFILGRYATAGQLIGPPNSYGSSGDTPRAYLVYAIAVSVVPGATLVRVIINDAYVALGSAGATWGRPVTGDLAGYAWVDYLDGSQTAAHPDLLAAFATDADRPWLSDMEGPGLCYAVCRFKYNRERFNGLPSVRFEVLGIPLYDPRADTSVGGSGAQRWADRSTWTQTVNPVLIIYNILRGIDAGAGLIWGGDAKAADLPLASWFAAMNECDVAIPLTGGGTEPQYRCGIEVALDDEPATVIEELLKVCSGQIVEVGGVWKVRCGPPSMPVYVFTDEDVLVSREQEFDPFPALGATWNGITATYPEPDSLWEPKEAPPRYNAAWEAEDGNRRLVASLQLPASPYGLQNQRIMAAYIADERRHRRHRHALPPEASILEPLDTVAWTSARNGYTAKVFEVTGVGEQLMSLIPTVQLRERDAGDYSWSPSDEVSSAPALPGVTRPVFDAVPDFAITPLIITDGNSNNRSAAILLTWDAEQATYATGLVWEAQRLGDTVVLSGSTQDHTSGRLVVSEGIMSRADYEVRARLVAEVETTWTVPTPVTAPDVDFLAGVNDPTLPLEYISYTPADGLKVVNAQFAFDTVVAAQTTITTSQTLTLDPSAELLSLTLVGGGQAGSGGTTLQSATATVATLYEAGVTTGISWSSASGTGSAAGYPPSGSSSGGAGRSTAYGAGGRTASNSSINATGYGAGGGGHNLLIDSDGGSGSGSVRQNATAGGASSDVLTVIDFDLTPYSAPSLVITVGVKGRRQMTADNGAGSPAISVSEGSPGIAFIDQMTQQTIPAGVVPFTPTAVGTFAKGAGATGAAIFPNLSPGLWVLTTDANTTLLLDAIEIDAGGTQLFLANTFSASFVASKRPEIVTANAAARTIRFAFYKMEV